MKKPDNFKFILLQNATLVGEYGIPLVSDNISSLPTEILPFNIALQLPVEQRENTWVHFYIDDYQFERIWNNPFRYLDILKQFKGVIGPNFSMFANMPKAISIFNLYRNNTLCNFYKQNGVEIIPWKSLYSQTLRWFFLHKRHIFNNSCKLIPIKINIKQSS